MKTGSTWWVAKKTQMNIRSFYEVITPCVYTNPKRHREVGYNHCGCKVRRLGLEPRTKYIQAPFSIRLAISRSLNRTEDPRNIFSIDPRTTSRSKVLTEIAKRLAASFFVIKKSLSLLLIADSGESMDGLLCIVFFCSPLIAFWRTQLPCKSSQNSRPSIQDSNHISENIRWSEMIKFTSSGFHSDFLLDTFAES